MLKEKDHVFVKNTLIQPSENQTVFLQDSEVPDYKAGELRTCFLDLHGYSKGGCRVILTKKLFISEACIIDQLSSGIY
jgi:hypothetical protein